MFHHFLAGQCLNGNLEENNFNNWQLWSGPSAAYSVTVSVPACFSHNASINYVQATGGNGVGTVVRYLVGNILEIILIVHIRQQW